MVVNAALLRNIGPRGAFDVCNNTFTRGMIWRTLNNIGLKGPTQCPVYNNSCRFESDLNMNGHPPALARNNKYEVLLLNLPLTISTQL